MGLEVSVMNCRYLESNVFYLKISLKELQISEINYRYVNAVYPSGYWYARRTSYAY